MRQHDDDDGVDRAFRALGVQLGARRRRRTGTPEDFPAFRAAVDERLRSIEREVAEAKQRINALLLMFAGTVVSALAMRLAEALS